MQYSLSIIIPTYNTERFIKKAIESCIEQAEASEIVVVDDGSSDDTIQIVQELQSKYPIVRLFHHPNNVNKGRSATRNLGIQKATGYYIAFLDADDYYLPNRFANDFKIFESNSNCDGVYNAVGFHFYHLATDEELKKHQLYTVRYKVAPDALFENLLYGKCGHFHINGLTVRKSVFEATGLFNEELIVAEDTEMFWKMAIKSRLETGIIDKAVAVRGVHENNIYNNHQLYGIYTFKMYETLLVWCANNEVDFKIKDEILKKIWIVKQSEKNALYEDVKYWFKLFVPNLKLLLGILSIKYFPIIRYRQMLFPFLYR